MQINTEPAAQRPAQLPSTPLFADVLSSDSPGVFQIPDQLEELELVEFLEGQRMANSNSLKIRKRQESCIRFLVVR